MELTKARQKMTDTTSSTALILTERIRAPRDLVFDFLIDQEKLRRWMGNVTADPTPGGDFLLDMGDHRATGEFLTIDAPNSVSFTWGWDHTEAVPPGSTVVTISLSSDGDGTMVELRHDGLPLGPEDEHSIGWSRCLDRLPHEIALAALRSAELALMLDRERVAQLRRDLPPGPAVSNYVFDSLTGEVPLSDLFTDDNRELVIYHFMFGNLQETPCPMCAMWADGWNGIAKHLSDRIDFVVATSGTVDENTQLVAAHDWRNLTVVSAANNSFKTDIGGEDEAGNQQPFISVYEKTPEGIRLSYRGSAHIEGDHWRGVDLLSPVWHILDLTRGGRGDWMPALS
jgi:predicted dithiol-disulfide oxidoreductase (DUF899 family)